MAALLGALLLATGCVHAHVERTGRLALGDGKDGYAPVLAAMPQDFEEVAVVRVEAEGLATPERLEKHLARKASLLGCGGIIDVRMVGSDAAVGTCVRRREPLQYVAQVEYRVVAPPPALLAKAKGAGVEGQALLQVLAQAEQNSGKAKAWPLRWYLQNYPESPFRADVEALFVADVPTHDMPASVRGAPVLR